MQQARLDGKLLLNIDPDSIEQNTQPSKYMNVKPYKTFITEDLQFTVADTPSLIQLYYYILKKYHYFPTHRRAGRQIKFIVSDGEMDYNKLHEGLPHNLIGVISVGSAIGFNIECRDKFIGWNEEQRKRNFNRCFAEETRFQVLPWVKMHNLVSMIMSRFFRECRVRWKEKYGDELVMLQAFSDNVNYGGVSYKASGWIYVGTTKKGNMNVFVKPLHRYWSREMLRCH